MTKYRNYILTAADERFYKNLRQLIYSYKRVKEYEGSTLIIYDIGLTPKQAQEIKRMEIESENHLYYRYFDFNEYPEFVKPKYRTYSWKPILIYLASLEHRGNFLWMDSANIILKRLDPIWQEIESKCNYAPISGSSDLETWTLQATFDYLNVPKHFYKKKNRAGNTFGFSIQCEVMKDLVYRWKELALIKECIKPEGAYRLNHKDDQSLLTILLYEQEEKGTLELTNEKVDISTSNPSKYYSVRNFFPKRINMNVGLIAHYYFLINRRLDIFINKLTGN